MENDNGYCWSIHTFFSFFRFFFHFFPLHLAVVVVAAAAVFNDVVMVIVLPRAHSAQNARLSVTGYYLFATNLPRSCTPKPISFATRYDSFRSSASDQFCIADRSTHTHTHTMKNRETQPRMHRFNYFTHNRLSPFQISRKSSSWVRARPLNCCHSQKKQNKPWQRRHNRFLFFSFRCCFHQHFTAFGHSNRFRHLMNKQTRQEYH